MTPNESTNPTEMNADTTNEKDALGAAAYTAVGVLTEMQKRDAYYARDVGEAIEELEAGLETPGVAETPAGERAAAAVERLEVLENAAPDEWGPAIREALADLAPVAADVADHDTFDATDDTTTDADTDGASDDGDIPLLAAAVTAREILQDVDPATTDDDQESLLINALEALDNIYIDASPNEIAGALGAEDTDEIDTRRPRRTSERPTVPVFFQVPPVAADRAIDRFNRRRENGRPVRAGGADLEEYIYDEIDQRHRVYVGDETLAEYASEAGLETLTLESDEEE